MPAGDPVRPPPGAPGAIFRELARQNECAVEEGHLLLDRVHLLLSIPPKYAVAQVVGFLKGKSAIHIARTYLGRQQNFLVAFSDQPAVVDTIRGHIALWAAPANGAPAGYPLPYSLQRVALAA